MENVAGLVVVVAVVLVVGGYFLYQKLIKKPTVTKRETKPVEHTGSEQ